MSGSARIRSDFWVSAHLRRCAGQGIDAVLRRRGAAEAGAIFVTVDRLDGAVDLYAPAPQTELAEGGTSRLFERVMVAASPPEIEARMTRELRFDPDLWWVSIDDRDGRSLLDTASAPDA
jgi:hypothetical protein